MPLRDPRPGQSVATSPQTGQNNGRLAPAILLAHQHLLSLVQVAALRLHVPALRCRNFTVRELGEFHVEHDKLCTVYHVCADGNLPARTRHKTKSDGALCSPAQTQRARNARGVWRASAHAGVRTRTTMYNGTHHTVRPAQPL